VRAFFENPIFTSGIYPSKWSESFVCPVFKADDPNNPVNYRGIAINNSIGKLFNLVSPSILLSGLSECSLRS
jgi:hypothetical protein